MYSNVSHLNICDVQEIMKVKLAMEPLSSQNISDQFTLKIKVRGYVQCGSTAQVLNKIFLGVDRLPALKQILLF